MKQISIKNGDSILYDIVIRNDFNELSERFKKLGFDNRKVCIVTDSNVEGLYLQAVKDELSKANVTVFSYTIPAGESNKTLEVVQGLYEYLIINKFDRKDCLAALGGGVVGDLTGYSAATYLRGIDFIQIPTTLLAQTDSSIGGKTGVDFGAYKNMVGAFHQPRLVYMNMSTLKSLDQRLFLEGMGEILKHGLIKNAPFYKWLCDKKADILALEPETLEEMIYQSCLVKAHVVENDPKEQGERALLNFGHTLGHAIEKLCNFTMYHGECVVLGMAAAVKLSNMRNLIDAVTADSIIETFKDYGFNVTVDNILKEDVLKVSKNDKKMDAGKIKFILLNKVGDAFIDKTVTDEEILSCLANVCK